MKVSRVLVAPLAVAALALGAAGCAQQEETVVVDPQAERIATLERQLAERDAQLQQALARAQRAEQEAAQARAAAERAQDAMRAGMRK